MRANFGRADQRQWQPNQSLPLPEEEGLRWSWLNAPIAGSLKTRIPHIVMTRQFAAADPRFTPSLAS
jgi:hypothetical protein